MAQSFDPDVYKKIVSVVDDLESGAISKLPTAIEVVSEQAKASGITNLIASTTNAAEIGIPAFTKAYKEMLDCCKEYTDKAKSVFDALGIEV